MPDKEAPKLGLTIEDAARIDQIQEELGLNPVNVLHAALTGSTTSTGESGIILTDGTDYPFLAPSAD